MQHWWTCCIPVFSHRYSLLENGENLASRCSEFDYAVQSHRQRESVPAVPIAGVRLVDTGSYYMAARTMPNLLWLLSSVELLVISGCCWSIDHVGSVMMLNSDVQAVIFSFPFFYIFTFPFSFNVHHISCNFWDMSSFDHTSSTNA